MDVLAETQDRLNVSCLVRYQGGTTRSTAAFLSSLTKLWEKPLTQEIICFWRIGGVCCARSTSDNAIGWAGHCVCVLVSHLLISRLREIGRSRLHRQLLGFSVRRAVCVG